MLPETITTAEVAAIDLNCEYYGLSRLQLMENAGKSIADEIKKRFDHGRVGILAGLGNNGGDAFVAARHLKGFDIEVFLLGKASNIKTDIAKKNFEIVQKAGIPVKEIRDSKCIEVDGLDIIVDAMLGTGVKGKLREPYASAVEAIGSCKAYVVAVDVPTGLNPDTGEYEIAVRADLTITFHRAKPGLLKAKDVVGELVVRDIGIPPAFETLAGPGDIRMIYRRQKEGHKGTHGRVLVVGGGPYTGAPALAALAAYAAGADLVTVAVPEKVWRVVASFSPDLIVRKLKGDELGLKNIEEIQKLAAKHHVVVMGMGADDIREVAEEVLKLNEVKKAVLDAGALLPGTTGDVECILTPHRGEFKRVFGLEPSKQNVKKMAKPNTVVLLKGPEDLISDGKKVRINMSGNAGMTVGGTGDVLAGIAGAFLVHGNAFWAASAAAFVNGRAGDICFEKYGYNYCATNIIEKIPLAIKNALEF